MRLGFLFGFGGLWIELRAFDVDFVFATVFTSVELASRYMALPTMPFRTTLNSSAAWSGASKNHFLLEREGA